MTFIPPSKFESLFRSSPHWIDVRAPIEWEQGSIPGSINLPILNNEERHQIGLTYKSEGQEAAIDLGNRLVSGKTREQRIEAWKLAREDFPSIAIYCFRGGLRSRTAQNWLSSSGFPCPVIEGGYKALRNFLIQKLEENIQKLTFLVIGGPTGSGKTSYLYKSGRPFIDLEGIANHRGSVFGSMETPQPTQIDFENRLSVRLLELKETKEPILIESESRKIGKCILPTSLVQKIQTSNRLNMEVSLDERITNIHRDYVLDTSLGQNSDVKKFDDFRTSVEAITKRLGGLRATEILKDLDQSQKEFENGQGLESNRVWIKKLLTWYYDPLYKRQYPRIEKK